MSQCGKQSTTGLVCRLGGPHDGMCEAWHPGGYVTYWNDSMTVDIAENPIAGPDPVFQVTGDGAADVDIQQISPGGWPEGTFQQVFADIFQEAFDLMIAKHRSYGPANVAELGFHGVFSRLASDKVERLRNAMNGRVVKGKVELDFSETLADESVDDTLLDCLNYAAILIALKRGLWGRPLA